MLYPYSLPEVALGYCVILTRLFWDASSTRRGRARFMSYLEELPNKESSDPYEHLFQAYLRADQEEFGRLAQELRMEDYPVLVSCIQSLPQIQSTSADDPFFLLCTAPGLIKAKKLTPEQVEGLMESFPKCARDLCAEAYIQGLDLNWQRILEQTPEGDIACLAMAQKGQSMNEQFNRIYQDFPSFALLLNWMILAPHEALPEILQWPDKEEIMRALFLLGDASLIADQADHLASIRIDQMHGHTLLVFDEFADSRPILSSSPMESYPAIDPVRFRAKVSRRFQGKAPYLFGKKRSPESIAHLIDECSGSAVQHFRLVARTHAACE